MSRVRRSASSPDITTSSAAPSRETLRRVRALTALGGVSFALVAPPTDLWPAIWVGLGALYVSLSSATTTRASFSRAWLWATAANVVGLRFVPAVVDRFTPLGYFGGLLALVLLAAFQGLAWGLGGIVMAQLRKRTGLDPRVAFSAGVVFAASLPGVFGWSPAGALGAWPKWLQLAEYIGERGVSFLIALSAAVGAGALGSQLGLSGATPRERARRLAPLGASLLILGLVWGGGRWRMGQVEAGRSALPELKIGVVQGAVDARLRWQRGERDTILHRLRRLSYRAENDGAELVVWPEAAYTYQLPHRGGVIPRGRTAIVRRPVRGPVLAGLITRNLSEKGKHNAAAVFSEGKMSPPQAKIELLWFGERLPLGHRIPWLRRMFYRSGALIPGQEVVIQHAAGADMAVLNCYEDTLPALGRLMAQASPQLLVNITNDGWFVGTQEPELHLRLSVLRAIETRFDLVRAVNLGVPAHISSSGALVARGEAVKQGVLQVRARVANKDKAPTLYVIAGDLPLWILIALAALGSFFRKRKPQPST